MWTECISRIKVVEGALVECQWRNEMASEQERRPGGAEDAE